ncbi:MAG: hypothetical protein V4539_10305 [Bacteroidota bacterium]
MWQHWPARELPKIDIGGTQFYLDLRLWEMRDVDDFMNKICIDDLFETENGFKLCFDPKTKNLFQGTEEEYHALKDSLKIIELPSLGEMDAIGWKAYVQTWKEENPVLSALIERIPEVLNEMPHPQQKGVTAKDLLPQNDIDKSKGKSL